MELERQAYREFKDKSRKLDESAISDVSNKVAKLTDALKVKDE
jgi:hypothetical protein